MAKTTILIILTFLFITKNSYSLCTIEKITEVRYGPSEKYNLKWPLHPFTPLRKIKTKKDWYKISEHNNEIGWVKSNILTNKFLCGIVKINQVKTYKKPSYKMPINDDKKSISGDKKSISDDKKSISDDKKSISGDKKSISDDKKSISDDKKSIDDDKKSISDDKRPISDNKNDDNQPKLVYHGDTFKIIIISKSRKWAKVENNKNQVFWLPRKSLWIY